VILDAREFDEVARVHLPQRVPFGFHGSWVPDGAA
jgi:carotenoid cleavage dioxygenase